MSPSKPLVFFARRPALVLRMARPGFLAITVVACLVGIASARAGGADGSLSLALASVVLALLIHAAANMLNDHADATNGADEANAQGVYPFTGGSRLVQRGVVQANDMRTVALGLVVLAVPGGLWLVWLSGPVLLLVGLVGVLLGWAYSMPPLALMSRGMGELAVGLGWGLIVVGADLVQRGHPALAPVGAAASYALLVTNILLGNGFPDAAADARVGKRTLVVRLGACRAAWLYLALALLAHAGLVAMVQARVLPVQALWGLVSLPLSLLAALRLVRCVAPIRHTLVLGIVAAVLHGLGLAAGLWPA